MMADHEEASDGFAELHDGEGRLCATATSTLLVFDVTPQGRGALQS